MVRSARFESISRPRDAFESSFIETKPTSQSTHRAITWHHSGEYRQQSSSRRIAPPGPSQAPSEASKQAPATALETLAGPSRAAPRNSARSPIPDLVPESRSTLRSSVEFRLGALALEFRPKASGIAKNQDLGSNALQQRHLGKAYRRFPAWATAPKTGGRRTTRANDPAHLNHRALAQTPYPPSSVGLRHTMPTAVATHSASSTSRPNGRVAGKATTESTTLGSTPSATSAPSLRPSSSESLSKRCAQRRRKRGRRPKSVCRSPDAPQAQATRDLNITGLRPAGSRALADGVLPIRSSSPVFAHADFSRKPTRGRSRCDPSALSSPLPRFREKFRVPGESSDSKRYHRVGDLDEPGDVGAFHIVDVVRAAFLPVPHALFVDISHDFTQQVL